MPPESRFDPLANRLRYQILALQAAGNRAFADALRAQGLELTPTQAEVLEVLAEESPLVQNELGERLVCTSGNITRLLDRMEARDLVRREPDPDDRRRYRVHLTDAGRAEFETAAPVVEAFVSRIRDLYSDDELRTMVTLAERMLDASGVTLESRFPDDPGSTRTDVRSDRRPPRR